MKKIIILLIVSVFLFSFLTDSVLAKEYNDDAGCGKGERCEIKEGSTTGKYKRPLELVYPSFGTEENNFVPRTVAAGLPQYVKYIFRFAIGIIGFIIFGVFIYAGIEYLFLSVGDPKKLMGALDRIKSAGLGSLLLLCSYIIFNTINPQLTILELQKMTSLPGVVTPGVYICNYEYTGTGADSIESILNTYINETDEDKQLEAQLEATKKFKNIIIKNENEKCYRINFSGNLEFTLKTGNFYTMFIIPSVKIDPNDYTKRIAEYEYGIILHEKDNFRGQCQPYPNYAHLYQRNFDGFKTMGMNFDVKSVTIFRKPFDDVPDTATGITLFSCFGYNESDNFCPNGVKKIERSFKPDSYARSYLQTELVDSQNQKLSENIRSVKFNPQGSYFALVKDDQLNCAVLDGNDPDISNLPSLKTKDCGIVAWVVNLFKLKTCVPRIQTMMVYKGKVL